MAENLVQNLVCSKCGAEARPGAAFCFACGGEVVSAPVDQQAAPVSKESSGISSAWFRSDITAESQKLPPLKVEEAAVTEPAEAELEVEEKGRSGKLKSKVKNKAKKTGPLVPDTTKPLDIESEKPKVSPLNEGAAINKKPEDAVAAKTEAPVQNKLKSAASIRQKSKLAEKKRVEVVWAPPEGAPNIWFVAVALVLSIFAVGIFVVMLYIR